MALKNWLKDSYATHGNSTSKSTPKSGTTFDNDSKRAESVSKRFSDMETVKRQGNSSGGGRSSISKDTPPTDSKTSYQNGLMNGPNKGSGTKLKK
ncbi:hypothetical protein [Burkholderia vietnamiensis]|uniref:hypothetical protein n=1 Tax=Burkholderia vietnamiensis TaxID=60552 RepID=UPI0018DD8241|nr:hypothetical protein [Burkholderia vietnamiensis]MBH9642355.1 hypothetical protein [Burkholderia vietnamiensis]